MASRRSRERENARPWEQDSGSSSTFADSLTWKSYEKPDDGEQHDTERCPNTGDMFEQEGDDADTR